MTVRALEAELLLDARADLGEGPMWHADRGLVSWVDLYAGRLNWLALDGTAGPSVDVGYQLGCAVPTADGAVMLGTDHGFARLDDDGVHMLAEVEPDENSFLNDGKCDALGRFWAGTVGVGDDGLAVADGGSLYRLEVDGSVTRYLPATTLSNGMDWSPDGATYYYIDSGTGTIDAFDFDLATGELSRRRPVVDIPKEDGFADGLCVDSDGCLWTAVWGASEVRRYRPDGTLDQTVRVPVSQPTSVIFAGDQLDVLVITSASRHLDAAEHARQPHAGSVFCAAPGASGQPIHPCAALGAR
jgi:sugar lactone lactonase YvrE